MKVTNHYSSPGPYCCTYPTQDNLPSTQCPTPTQTTTTHQVQSFWKTLRERWNSSRFRKIPKNPSHLWNKVCKYSDNVLNGSWLIYLLRRFDMTWQFSQTIQILLFLGKFLTHPTLQTGNFEEMMCNNQCFLVRIVIVYTCSKHCLQFRLFSSLSDTYCSQWFVLGMVE
jgi:hypothetical protein